MLVLPTKGIRNLSSSARLPEIRLELIEDLSPPGQTGFLTMVRRRYHAHYPDGTVSAPFVYDSIDRPALDAVVIAAHFERAPTGRHVYLRSGLRPALLLRDQAQSPLPDERRDGALWELPAGLVEVSERGLAGVARSAQRELKEELGFDVPLEVLRPLGPSTYPAPGFVAERHFFFEVRVDPETRSEPELDGSALERFGVVMDVPLAEALAMCARGQIEDSKTELTLRRLAERFG